MVLATEKFKTELKKYPTPKFLHELYLAKTVPRRRKIIQSASVSEIDILLLLLHHIVVGNIPVKRENFTTIVKSKRLGVIRRFVQTFIYQTIENKSLEDKKTFLSSIPCYKQLLFEIFNKR